MKFLTCFNCQKRIRRALGTGAALAISAAVLYGCSNPFGGDIIRSTSLFAMDTVMELQIQGSDKLLSEGESMIRTLEKELSVTDDESEIARLNDTGSAELTEDVALLMKEALEICESTDGALDITIYPVLKAWGFTTGKYQIPEETEISKLLENVDYKRVQVSNGTQSDAAVCTIPDGTEVDLGSVAKGYTSRELARFFTENGVKSGLINLGGNVQCIGSKLNGESWKIAIKSPFRDSASEILGVIGVSDVAVVTSGGYERFFEEDGNTYWHIIDPATGKPANNGLISVTIIGKDALLCDGLSTALFVKGLDGAIEYYRKDSSSFDMILVSDEGEVYVTEGISDSFQLGSEYYNLKVNLITP